MNQTNKARLIASGVIAATLFAGIPVFADSGNSGRDNNGLHLGVFAKILKDQREDRREDRRDDRREDRREDRRDDRKHATSTSATTTRQVSIEGTITAVNGAVLTVQGQKGATYTVNAANAAVTGHNGTALTLNALAVNDKVKVSGALTGTVIVATKVKDKSDTTGKMFRAVSAGIVTAINGSTIIFDRFGSPGTSTASVNAATVYKANGQATTSSALKVGSHVIIAGSSTAATGGTMNASVVYIITEGYNWLKHFWR